MTRRLLIPILSALLLIATVASAQFATHTPRPPGPIDVTAQPAGLTDAYGWSCEDFPCEDDLEGWLARIQVPPGFVVERFGQFPGQPMQIAFAPDGRLAATVLENGTRQGAVYALNADGTSERLSPTLITPYGLAFDPADGSLYVTARVTLESGGALWRIAADGTALVVLDSLPCCRNIVSNQPEALGFGLDGALYIGVSSLSDRAEPSNPQVARYATPQPNEASILRYAPGSGTLELYAQGIREPTDLTFDSRGRMAVSDTGTLDGIGDRLILVERGAHYGFPFYRNRGCEECPPTDFSLDIRPDLLTLPASAIPRGVAFYEADAFPPAYQGALYAALWNGIPGGQQVIRVDVDDSGMALSAQPFVTGLIRPVDIAVAPDGSLLVADFIYGQVWRVRWDASTLPTPPSVLFATATPGN